MNDACREELQRDLTELADGDRSAFRPVFVRLWPVVRDFARRQLPPEDAEDAAQRALLRVFERANEFDPSRDALAWVLGVTAWEIRSVRRWRYRRRETGEPSVERAVLGATPEDLMMGTEIEAAVREVLGDLSPADADVLRAFAEERRPEGAAFRKRLQRARARLREAWRQRHG